MAQYRAIRPDPRLHHTPLTLEFFQDLNEPNPLGAVAEPWLKQHLPDVEKIVEELAADAEAVLQRIDSFFNKELGSELGKQGGTWPTNHTYTAII